MKIKVLTVLLIFILVFQSFAFAEYQFGTGEEPELIVSGIAEPGEKVSFVLLNSQNLGCSDAASSVKKFQDNIDNEVKMDSDEIFHMQSLRADSDGKWSHTIPMTGINYIELTLFVDNGDANYIKFASNEYKKGIIPILKGKANISDNGVALSASISEYIDFISDKSEQYSKLSNKTMVAKLVSDIVKELDENSDMSVATLQIALDEAVLIESVKEEIVKDFEQAISIIDYETDAIAEISADGRKKVTEMLSKENYARIADYKEYAKKQVALQRFNYNINPSGDALAHVLMTSNNILKLDLTAFEGLTNADKTYVAGVLASKKSETVAIAQINLNGIINNLNKETPSGSGGPLGGGGSGGGGGGSENKAFASSAGISITEENIQEQKYIFSDMKAADWATDAIYYLAGKAIVNGYSDNTFRPLNPITRAEFTKIIVATFFPSEQSESNGKFNDVKESDWFAEYVNIAYNVGIVSGDENGNFNPNAPISRQDMAVIIYNTCSKFNMFTENKQRELFEDNGNIADYAKEAVYCLKNNSVINGVGEGRFAPLDNANRASAAQIIYSVMMKHNK